jgi:Tfp pilus assembly protein FimT
VIAQLAGYDIETSAKEISSALIVARVRAIDTSMPHRVKFDLNSTPQRFIIQRGTTSRGVTTWFDDVSINEVRGDVTINKVDDVKGQGRTAGIGSIEFGSMGNPTKGVIYLEDSEGERCTVALNVATGKVGKIKGW